MAPFHATLSRIYQIQTADNFSGSIIDASRKGHANVVELLLSKGADANAEIKSIRETALHKASRLGHSEVVEVLLAQGGANVNRVNRNGDTPLHIAAMLGREAVVRSLIAHGAEVNKFYWEWEDTEVGKAGDLGPTGVTNQPLKDRMPPNRQDIFLCSWMQKNIVGLS